MTSHDSADVYYCVFSKRYDGKFSPVISTLSTSERTATKRYSQLSFGYECKQKAGIVDVRQVVILENEDKT